MSFRVPIAALLFLAILSSVARAEPLIRYRLEAVDALNQPVTTVGVGEDFTLRGYVEDLRTEPALYGVASAYLGAFLDSSQVTSTGPLSLDPFFDDLVPLTFLGPSYLLAGGLGLVINVENLPTGEQLVFSVPMEGTNLGTAAFAPVVPSGDDLEWLLFGQDAPVLSADIELVGLRLNIVPEPTSVELAGLGLCVAAWGFLGNKRRRPISVPALGCKL